ncbi:tyrosine-type recombinase/integrase [Vibrio cincinnatiensis]
MSLKSIKIHNGLSIRKLPQSKNFSVYIKFEGYPKRQFSLKTSDLDEAIAKAKAEYQFNKMMLDRDLPIQQPNQRLTVHKIIDQLVKEYETAQDKVKEKNRDGKHATHIRIFKKIKEFYDEKIRPSALDIGQVRSYFQEQPAFSNTQLVATRFCFTQIFDRAFEKKLISKDQIVDLKKIKVEKQKQTRRDHFTYPEFASYFVYGMNQVSKAHGKGIHTQKMAMFYSSFLFHSGVRAGFEALGITWSDLGYTSFGDLFCVIRDGKTKNYEKNNRNVIFDLFAEDCIHHAAQEKHSDLLKGMDKRKVITYLINKKPNEAIFSTKFSNKPSYDRIFKKWVDELKEAEVLPKAKELTLYSLRHSYITRSIENDVPLALIAENAGTSITMIEKHYSHVSVMTQKAREILLKDKLSLIGFNNDQHEQKYDKARSRKDLSVLLERLK